MLFSSSLSDINECTAADQLCDFNANCINTHGSYYCFCLSGFTGVGKSCQGKEILFINIIAVFIKRKANVIDRIDAHSPLNALYETKQQWIGRPAIDFKNKDLFIVLFRKVKVLSQNSCYKKK